MSDDDIDFVPWKDLSDRYEQIIEIQTKSIQNFDDKTWRTMRVTGMIAGAGLGVASFLIDFGGENNLPSGPSVKIGLSLSIFFFILSFAFGIRCYQSAEFATAPPMEIGDRIKDSPPEISDYRSKVVGSYAAAVEHNKSVLNTKKKRFKHTLAALFLGIWLLAIVFLLTVWSPSPLLAYIILTAGIITGEVSVAFALYGSNINYESVSDRICNIYKSY